MERIAADTAVPLPLQGLPGTSITFSPDGRHIAIGGQDGAKLCDLKTSNCSAMLQVRRQLQRVLTALAAAAANLRPGRWSPRLCNDGLQHFTCALLTDACPALLCSCPPQGHSEAVSSVAFSRDGKLATGSRDRSAKIWEHVTEGSRSVTPPEVSFARAKAFDK